MNRTKCSSYQVNYTPINIVRLYCKYTSYAQDIIDKVPFNRSSGILVPLVKIKSVLIIVDGHISIAVDLKDSERWFQVRIANIVLVNHLYSLLRSKRRCNIHDPDRCVISIASDDFKFVIMSMTKELSSNDVGKSIDKSAISGTPFY